MSQKGPFGPFWILLGHLKHQLKHLFYFRHVFGKTTQNEPDTFSDTPELLDPPPDSVLDTF